MLMPAEELVDRARAGDTDAFGALVDPFRRELQRHCYRLLGSVHDAEDLLQETLLAAWRGLEQFEGRASVRTWLYRIATHRCLNALRDRQRRAPRQPPEPPFAAPPPTRRNEPRWYEPYPDALLDDLADTEPGPAARYETKETIELAFIAGLQQLRPRQRAALVLRDVLGFRTDEVATLLGTSPSAVASALQRARATLAATDALPPPGDGPTDTERDLPSEAGATDTERERTLAQRFAAAFAADDVDGVVKLLSADAWLTMPPSPLAYQGLAAIAAFLRASAAWRAGRHFRLLPTRANTQPAFGLYVAPSALYVAPPAAATPVADAVGLIVLRLTPDGQHIAAITRFLFGDPAQMIPFGLPTHMSL